MPATKAQRSEAARKAAATRKRHAMEGKQHEQASPVEQRSRRCGSSSTRSTTRCRRSASAPSRRQEIVDAAMDMADRLVHTQYDFLRRVVQSAGKTLSREDEAKK